MMDHFELDDEATEEEKTIFIEPCWNCVQRNENSPCDCDDCCWLN